MKFKAILFVVMFAGLVACCSDAHARRWFRGRNYSTTTYRSSGPTFSGTDQERCYAEAAYCAARNIRGHVGQTIGFWEGAGWGGSSANCQTCTPPRGMTKTGDASVHGPWGWFRVVSYR